MTLPLSPPLLPQLARAADELPEGDGWAYEPKWDGFRAVVFVDGDRTYVQSRQGKDLGRYFPELVFPPGRYVLDGELVIATEPGRVDFEALQTRIHPARSRIERLARETPARLVAFDVLAWGDESLLAEPFAARRRRLDDVLGGSVLPTPYTEDPVGASAWLRSAEGVVAKELSAPYRPGERLGMRKIKRVRTIDCVVAGWRTGKEPGTVGSLMLGLYNGDRLEVIGHTSGFNAAERRRLAGFLAPYETGRRGSGEASRWTGDRDLEWAELRPELVVEVAFDHVSGGRIRHGTKLLRWRDDRDPAGCTIDQLDS